MKDKIRLLAKKRTVLGRKVKNLRKEGVLPGSLYGKGIKSVPVQVGYGDFEKVFKEAGETQLVYLSLEKEEVPVLIHNVQKDPLRENFLHADFMKVNLKEKVVASVPVVGVGESPVEKQGLGTVVFYIDELEVEALPTDIPEKIEVDTSVLTEVDQSILVSDLVIDKTKLEIKAKPDGLVAKVEAAKEEEEEPAVAEASNEGETKEETTSENQSKAPEENKEEN